MLAKVSWVNMKRKCVACTVILICLAFDTCCLKRPFQFLLQSFEKILSKKVGRRCNIMNRNTIIRVLDFCQVSWNVRAFIRNLPQTNNLHSFPQQDRHDFLSLSSLLTLINYFTSKFHQKCIHLFQVGTTDMLNLEVSQSKAEHLPIPYILLTSRDCMYIWIAHIHYLCACTHPREMSQQIDFREICMCYLTLTVFKSQIILRNVCFPVSSRREESHYFFPFLSMSFQLKHTTAFFIVMYRTKPQL